VKLTDLENEINGVSELLCLCRSERYGVCEDAGRGGTNRYSLSHRGTTRGANVQNREMETGGWYKNHLPKEVVLFKYYLKMSYPEFR
jgi:hypothetical protein